MVLEWIHYAAAVGIGVVGSSAVLFASRMALEDFKELSDRLYSVRNVIIYIGLGGLIAGIVQSSSEAFSPIFALATGAGWPAVIQGLVAARKSSTETQKIADEQLKEFKALLGDIPS